MLKFTTIALAAVSIASAAAAQSDAPKISRECREQIKSICHPDGDHKAMRTCVMTNVDKFTPACQAEIKARKDAMRAHRAEAAGNGAAKPQ